jgi:hypothetical protein
MRIISQDLSPVSVIYRGSDAFTGGTFETALEKYPSNSEVVELREEIRATKRRIEELAKSLRDMGV